MTNVRSVAGGALWMAVAAILMLAALEPVSVGTQPGVSVEQSDGQGTTAVQAA
jgi:hypothetical protein